MSDDNKKTKITIGIINIVILVLNAVISFLQQGGF